MRKRIAIGMFVLVLCSTAFAATANWTGRSWRVETVTHKWVWKCEYRLYNRDLIYRLFDTNCPSSIEVY